MNSWSVGILPATTLWRSAAPVAVTVSVATVIVEETANAVLVAEPVIAADQTSMLAVPIADSLEMVIAKPAMALANAQSAMA